MILQGPDLQMGLSDLQRVLIGVSLAAKASACVEKTWEKDGWRVANRFHPSLYSSHVMRVSET